MKTLIQIFFFLMTLLVAFSCNKIRVTDLTYEGYIYKDTVNSPPYPGIQITLEGCGSCDSDRLWDCPPGGGCSRITIGQSTTDASGHFSIKGKEVSSHTYFVYTSSKYHDYINISGCSEKDLNTNAYTRLLKK
jgi:hypothetical protein